MKRFSMFLGSVAIAMAVTAAAATERVSVTWDFYSGGLNFLEISARGEVTDSAYRLDAEARSKGLLDMFTGFRARSVAEGTQGGSGPEPSRYTVDATYSSGERRVVARRDGAGWDVAVERDTASYRGPEVVAPPLREGALDPLSVLLALNRSGGTEPDGLCRQRFVVFDGRRRHEISLVPDGRERLDGSTYNVYSGEAVRCIFRSRTVEGPRRDEDTGALGEIPEPVSRDGYVWLGQPGASRLWLPVRLHGDSKYGPVIIHLSRFDATS